LEWLWSMPGSESGVLGAHPMLMLTTKFKVPWHQLAFSTLRRAFLFS
jgi:hypothetical protein